MSQSQRGGRRQRLVRAVVYAIVLLTVIGMVLAMVGTAWAEPLPTTRSSSRSHTSPASTSADAPQPIVVLGTTDLSWADLVGAAQGDATARTLLEAAGTQAPVNLVQRAAGPRTCPADGWLTLGAGARTRAVPVAQEAAGCAWPGSWAQAAAQSRASGYGAEPGTLADALAAEGVPSTAVGRGAVLALTRSTGSAPRTAATLGEVVSGGLPPLTLVDLSDPSVAGATGAVASPTTSAAQAAPDGASTATGALAPGTMTPEASAAAVVAALSVLPADARVVIVSLADPSTPGLQAAVLPAGTRGTDAGTPDAVLPASPSTHRDGLVQTADLTATLSQELTGRVPTAVTGGALTLPAGGRGGLAGLTSGQAGATTAQAGPVAGPVTVPPSVTGLVDGALRARASNAATLPVSVTIVLTALALLVVTSQALRGPRGRLRLHGTALAATAVAALPGGAWLTSTVPWWRLGSEGDTPSPWAAVTAVGATVLLALVLALVLQGAARVIIVLRDRMLVGRHRADRARAARGTHGLQDPPGPDARASVGGLLLPSSRTVPGTAMLTALLLALCTPALILGDAAAGAPLAFNGALGMDAVLAGRFYGVSNTAFALAAAALTVSLGAVAGPWVAVQRTRRARRTAALAGVLVPGTLALLADGLPWLGADVGGAATLVAVLLALATTLAGGRIGWKRWLSIAVVAVSVVGLFGLVDHATGSRTHLGRFVGQLQAGTAGTTILRKATAVAAPFLSHPLALLALVAAALLVLAGSWWLRRELRAWQAGRSGYAPLVQPEPLPGEPLPRAPREEAEQTPDEEHPGMPWAGPVPHGAAPVPEWFLPVLKALGVLLVVEVLVNDSGASMAVLSAAVAAPLLLALAAARLAGEPLPH